MRDSASFFAALRPRPFARLDDLQAAGLDAVVAAMEAASWPLGFAAYGLATAAHETARTMQPIRERGGDAPRRDGHPQRPGLRYAEPAVPLHRPLRRQTCRW